MRCVAEPFADDAAVAKYPTMKKSRIMAY